jgi:hypothetical protein
MFEQDDSLTNHPAKRNVMAFLRVMVVDSLSLPPTPKLPPVIDSILDAQPELSTPAQQNRFAFISQFLEAVLRNHDILVRIRIRGSCYFCH